MKLCRSLLTDTCSLLALFSKEHHFPLLVFEHEYYIAVSFLRGGGKDLLSVCLNYES